MSCSFDLLNIANTHQRLLTKEWICISDFCKNSFWNIPKLYLLYVLIALIIYIFEILFHWNSYLHYYVLKYILKLLFVYRKIKYYCIFVKYVFDEKVRYKCINNNTRSTSFHWNDSINSDSEKILIHQIC